MYLSPLGTFRQQPRSRNAGLRVATYNVNFALSEDPETLSLLERIPADVLLLQETNEQFERSLRDRLRTRFPTQHFVSSPHYPAGGIAVLSRYPMHSIRELRSVVGWFSGLLVLVQTPFGPVQFLNVHLQPPLPTNGGYLRGLARAPEVHQQELEAFLPALSERIPTIIAGDFNEAEHRRALPLLTTHGFASALSQFDQASTTWRWPVGPITLRDRFDHILFEGRNFHCVQAEVISEGNSDHLPVVAAFQFRRTPTPTRSL